MTADAGETAELTFREEVRDATAYVPDWLGLDRSAYLRLDRNESTRQLSDEVAVGLAEHVRKRGLFSYPEPDRLAGRVGEYCAVSADSVVVTNGSDQAIDLCLRGFLGVGDRLLVARPEFSMFTHIADLIGAVVDGVPYADDLSFPYEAFWAAARQRPELIVLINPNNPTGTPVDLDFIERVAAEYPDIPVIVDEAYFEFTGVTAVPLIRTHPNVIVLRTFSKAFALAGLRIGYLVARPAVAAQLKKLRNPFDVNELALVAADIQLSRLDEVHAHVAEIMGSSKPMVVDFFRRVGVPVFPGAANFVLVKPAQCAEAIAYLRDSGILVRSTSARLLAGMFRMSIGTPTEMTEFIRVYEAYLSGHDS
jgi:histidinol-phosphate aminotransferase